MVYLYTSLTILGSGLAFCAKPILVRPILPLWFTQYHNHRNLQSLLLNGLQVQYLSLLVNFSLYGMAVEAKRTMAVREYMLAKAPEGGGVALRPQAMQAVEYLPNNSRSIDS
jgi:hypothetical protein